MLQLAKGLVISDESSWKKEVKSLSSRVQKFKSSMLRACPTDLIKFPNFTVLVGQTGSRVQGYRVTALQNFRVTGLQRYRISGLQGYMIT
jgi:hypothetical protein